MNDTPVNDAAAVISALPARAARLLAVDILLAEPEALGDDLLETCLYILRERLSEEQRPGGRGSTGCHAEQGTVRDPPTGQRRVKVVHRSGV